jgi:choline dehydrogenase
VGRGLDAPDPFITLTIAMSQPASRGRIQLRSVDPLAAPVIKPNYLSEPGDLDAMVDGVRLAQSIGTAAPMRSYAAMRSIRAPGVVGWDVRPTSVERPTPSFIPGTCRMGTAADTVCDPQLRVRGVRGLRVADASVIPTNLNSQIHAACVDRGDGARFVLGV